MSDWIINQDQKGFMFSRELIKFPIINYDTLVGSGYSAKSLKELEAYMGHDIRETTVPFDIDRKLTDDEKLETEKYCFHDVMETFEVFLRNKTEWDSHVGLVQEFGLNSTALSKTKAQISAIILGAVKQERNDEFDLIFPETLDLGRYEYLKDRYLEWAKKAKEMQAKGYDHEELYKGMSFKEDINGVPHVFGVGGLHGAIPDYMGEGTYIMADVGSYYPAIMIEYDFLSRNVRNPKKYTQIRDERIVMKRNKDPRQQPRKIVLNSTFGASKDRFNNLYDPLMANNVCIAGQLLLVDLLDKLYGKCELIQSNTDGILIKLYRDEDREEIMAICDEWCKRTRMELEYDEYRKVVQSNVNNYIIVDADGKSKSKGSVAKKQHDLDYNLPILNKVLLEYYLYGTDPRKTIMECDDLRMFQKIYKISRKYDYGVHNGKILSERVHRCFASTNPNDTELLKKHRDKEYDSLDRVADTPDHCFITNDNVLDKKVPMWLDKEWYIWYTTKKIKAFLDSTSKQKLTYEDWKRGIR